MKTRLSLLCGWPPALALVLALARGAETSIPVGFEDGSRVNLLSARGTQATASANFDRRNTSPDVALHKLPDGLQFHNAYGPCWWMAEFPQAYPVAHVRVYFLESIASVGLRIRAAAQLPSDWNKVPDLGSYHAALTPIPGVHGGYADVSFPAVQARWVRIEFDGHNGGEDGKGTGVKDLAIQRILMTGPDPGPITDTFSSAQAAWAGGQCTLQDGWNYALDHGVLKIRSPRNAPKFIDDNLAAASDLFSLPVVRAVNTAPSEAMPMPALPPSSLVVTLLHRTRVTAVAYATAGPTHKERPRDLKIYTSPFATGDAWTLQKELTDIAAGGYVEIPLDHPATAKRVRFDFTRVWNDQVDTRNLSFALLTQVYVYGKPLPPDLLVPVPKDALASAQIVDREGVLMRNVQDAHVFPSGQFPVEWDGLDTFGQPVPPGDYQCRIILNSDRYESAGAIGNTALPPNVNQNPTSVSGLAADAGGDVYSVNGWEEAGQDFRKWSRDDGAHVYDARALIRNGNPNAVPYAIAVDDLYLYCATVSHTVHHQQHIRRFRLSDGHAVPFPLLAASNGHILVHDWPEKETASPPKRILTALAVSGDKLFVADALSNLLRCYDKNSGAPLSTLPVNQPQAMAVDSLGQVWAAHDGDHLLVVRTDGTQAALTLPGLVQAQAMAFGPGDRLYIADAAAGKIVIGAADPHAPSIRLQQTFGQPARPGDSAPDRFYNLSAIAVDSQGYCTVAQGLVPPGSSTGWMSGSRVIRFSPDFHPVWDQVGGEFCNIGTYAAEQPDQIITQHLHRYTLDPSTRTWKFAGALLEGDTRFGGDPHGAPRLQTINGQTYFFQGYADRFQVYKRVGDAYRLAAMFALGNSLPDGSQRDRTKQPVRRNWSWHDANGDGKVEEDEVQWLEGKPLDAGLDINSDADGNAILCLANGAIGAIVRTSFDANGNPVYDLAHPRVLIPHGTAADQALFSPMMAVRSDDGSFYAFGRSDAVPKPKEGDGGWMCGWMLTRYDAGGRRLWSVPLPNACPGMDAIPGGGVMLISIKWEDQGSPFYHFDANGALIGTMYPAEQYRGFGGIPDNTASLAVVRNAHDGCLDVFAEDCMGNRFRWQRVDDRQKPQVIVRPVRLVTPGQPLRSGSSGH